MGWHGKSGHRGNHGLTRRHGAGDGQGGRASDLLGALGIDKARMTSEPGHTPEREKPAKVEWGRADPRRQISQDGQRAVTRIPRMGTGMVLAMLALWTLLAWAGYSLVDGLGAWLAGNASAVIQGGKDAATVGGLDQSLVGMLNVDQASGFVAQVAALARTIAKPLIVLAWFLGALAIIAMPMVLRLLAGRFGGHQR
ncbi:hypothetical protein PV773_19770 [Mesorhizobium sp. CC13]|uniref:hypothetical protein n=1 Tax=Mesorhizobium sp. CC13 TaxID=3029194 RepID=UPI0032651B92